MKLMLRGMSRIEIWMFNSINKSKANNIASVVALRHPLRAVLNYLNKILQQLCTLMNHPYDFIVLVTCAYCINSHTTSVYI